MSQQKIIGFCPSMKEEERKEELVVVVVVVMEYNVYCIRLSVCSVRESSNTRKFINISIYWRLIWWSHLYVFKKLRSKEIQIFEFSLRVLFAGRKFSAHTKHFTTVTYINCH
jgi:hypothetical protein